MFIRALIPCTTLAVCSIASADLVNPLVPAWAGDSTASRYEWNSFTEAYNAPNFPDSPFSQDVMLFNTTPGATIAGSGNIYNPAGGLNIHMYGSFAFELAVLNIATSGSELDYDDTYLFVSSANEAEYTEIYASAITRSSEPGGFGGVNVTVAYEFDTSGVDFEIADWGFFAKGTTAHISLDAARLDFNTVPVPASILGLGLISATRRRRR